ncbi:MAG TPA: diacylglycerol kinase [Jiangellaceae bacterium]|nr:diacylglycerol kinase [Jiangellaceae bacterium]
MSRQIALLVNPTSGRGRGARIGREVAARLRGAGLAVREMAGRDIRESQDLAREAVEQGTDALVVVGGDGMVHLGLQAVGGTEVPFGIAPAGTGNDFARAVGVPIGDPIAAADIVVAATERRIDLGRTGSQWFGGVVAAGFDARVNDRANRMTWPRGRMRYNVAMLIELGVFRPVPYVLELDGNTWATSAMLVVAGNIPSYGGGMRVTPDAVIDDGLLDVMVVKPLSKARFLTVFPRVYSGSHVNLPFVEIRRAKQVRIDAPGITAYADGERLGPLPQTFEAVPSALRIMVPAPSAR